MSWQLKNSNSIKHIYPYVLLALATTAISYYLLGGAHLDLHVPLSYSLDGLLNLRLIKLLIDGNWIYQSSITGYPFTSYFYDYPIPDTGSLFVLKIISNITKDPSETLNLYFLAGFPLNALVSYAVLQKFSITKTLSFIGSLLFTLAPFHFLRINHLFFTWYFVSPILTWYSYKIFLGSALFLERDISYFHRFLHVTILAAISLFGVYYALFGVIMILITGTVATLQHRSWKNIYTATLAASIVSLGVLINIAPSIYYKIQHGSNQEVAQRQASESEIYGLKLSQLLLPHPGHRSRALSNITQGYESSFPLVNENAYSSLGIVGSIGFLALLIALLIRNKNLKIDNRIYFFGLLTYTLLFFSTIGGFSSLFAIFISPMIRGWNRVSIFIEFLSISAFTIIFDKLLKKTADHRFHSAIMVLAPMALLFIGLWDQTARPCVSCIQDIKLEFTSDQNFVRDIEKTEPTGTAVYQLPYMPFPEVAPLNQLPDYGLFRGYINSSQFKWSYGGMKGREGDFFYRALSQQPISHQLVVLKKLGFGGIYIDRRGYQDHGEAIEAELTKLLNKPTQIVSQDGHLAFFRITHSEPLPNGLTTNQIMQHVGFVADRYGQRYSAKQSDGIDLRHSGLPTFVAAVQGLSIEEPWGRWSDASLSRTVVFSMVTPLPEAFTLKLTAKAFGPNIGMPVQVIVGTEKKTFIPTQSMAEYKLSFSKTRKVDVIEISPPKPTSPSTLGTGNDPRALGIGIEKLTIVPMKT